MSIFEKHAQFKNKMKDLDAHLARFKSVVGWINQNYERKAYRMTEFLKCQELLDNCWDGFSEEEKQKWLKINPVTLLKRR